MYKYKPASPAMSMKRGCRSPTISPASPNLFKCCDTSFKTVSVPRVKYILTQQPIVMEKIHKEVKYNQVPISYEFEKHRKPTKVIKACPRSPMCPRSQMSKWSKKYSPSYPKRFGGMMGSPQSSWPPAP